MSIPGIPVAARRRYGPLARIVTIVCGATIAAVAYLPWA